MAMGRAMVRSYDRNERLLAEVSLLLDALDPPDARTIPAIRRIG